MGHINGRVMTTVKPSMSTRFTWREDVRWNWRVWAEYVRIVRMHRGRQA